MVMDTATPGGRAAGPPAASKAKGPKSGAAGGAAGSAASGGPDAGAEGGGADTLELLAARAVHAVLALGEASGQLLPLARALGAGDDASARGDQGAGAGATAPSGAAALAAALPPVVLRLRGAADALLRAGCFKAAHAAVQSLLLLGKRLAALEAALQPPAAAKQQQQQQQQQEQQQRQEARAAAAAAVQGISSWAATACQQREPEVTSVPLIKALLEAHVRFSRECRPGAGAAGRRGA
jgi:hypothetical protein